LTGSSVKTTCVPLYDFRTKGCNDGLTRDGVNTNQGAESTLSFLLSLLAMIESYALVDQTKVGKAVQPDQPDVIKQIAGKSPPIKDVSAKAKTTAEKAEIEELI